jgi:hypothetical protein
MRFAVLTLVAACSFPASGAVDSNVGTDSSKRDARAIDGPGPTLDAALDAPGRVCKLQPKNGPRTGGKVGGNGGVANVPMPCPQGTLPVGFDFEISDGNTTNGGRSAYSMTELCAPLTLQAQALQVGAVQNVTASGTGGFGWTPSTASGPTTCPANTVPVGLKAFSGGNNNLLANFSIKCRGITGPTTFGTEQLVQVENTGNLADGADEVICNNNEMLVSAIARVGAGIDSVTLNCVQLECAP